MSKKKYDGYRSFQYLEPGVDYKAFKMAKDVGRVESHWVPLTPEQEQEVQAVLDNNTIVSLHDHTYVLPEDMSEVFDYNRTGRAWTGYAGLAISNLDVLVDNQHGLTRVTSKSGWKWTDLIHDIGTHFSDIAHQDMVYVAQSYDDLLRAKGEGRIALVAFLESCTLIENELDRLDVLHGFGFRGMGLTYSEANSLGCGLREANDGGLTALGKQVVRRMNKIGMTVDVSHCGDKTAADAIEVSQKPIVISHVGARALWNTSRLKPDGILKACAEKGGVIGIECAPHTALTRTHPVHTIEPFMEHFEYVANLVGIDHVGLGPDTFFGDHVGLHHAYAGPLGIGQSHAGEQFEEVEYVKGAENPGEVLTNAARWMVAHGYKHEDMAKALGGNALRVFKETWAR